MLSNDKQEILIQRLIDRIQQLNEDILVTIGESINKLNAIQPSKIHQIKQMLMYGTDLNKIINEIAKITNLNVKDIYDIFENEAKINQDFAKQFYKLKGIKYIPFEQNKTLKKQIKAIADITVKEYVNISKTSAIGYTIRDNKGNIVFKNVSDIYKEAIDKATLNIVQGKTTQSQEIRNFMKQIGQSGLKTVDYESGRSMRLDSALRMNIQQATRDMTNNLQRQFGEEFGADGVEISVHTNPAPDHAPIQGRQFTLKEYENMQNNKPFKDCNGKHYKALDRVIGQWNCYHYIFNVVLGVNKPLYTEKQLKEIEEKNRQGFEIDGKHYTNYEGTQLQRDLERKIREQKDIQILAVASKDKELVNISQFKITQYTNKYKQLCKVSGLPSQLKTRAVVSNYKRINTSKFNTQFFKDFGDIDKAKDLKEIGKSNFNFEGNEFLDEYVLKTGNISKRLNAKDINLKEKLDIIEPELDKLAKQSPIDFKLYSAKNVEKDYSKDKHLLSASISKGTANLYKKADKNKDIITVYVEKGANIISTVNTKNNQFEKQGEIILPTNRKMKKIDDYNYILKKD